MTDTSFSFDFDDSPRPAFETLSDPSGVLVYDSIQNVRFELYTETDVTLDLVDVDEVPFPVSAATTFSATTITIPKLLSVYARNCDFELIFSWSDNVGRQLSADNVPYLQLEHGAINLYLGVNGPVAVSSDGPNTVIELESETTVTLGARSVHKRPAGTITVPDDIDATMRAVSLLGSALKTTSPERSFPTLRGHPPIIERGDAFSVSGGISSPNTGVKLVLPPSREYVYPATSLAYYLGADVVSGTSPRLVTDGIEHPLDEPADYETTVGKVLQHVFFLDCLTRTEGLYDTKLHERQQVERSLDIDFAGLYDTPLAERLREYLTYPFETLQPHIPEWPLTTDVIPTPENVEFLPFVADDLSLVRCPESPRKRPPQSSPAVIGNFCRSSATEPNGAVEKQRIVEPKPVETIDHAWVGDGYPLGSNKVTIDSRRRHIDRTTPENSEIQVRVVCNDEKMAAEGTVKELYGFRKLVEYDVDIKYDRTTDELRDLIASPIDFLHYIGHVDHDGIQCTDGILDTRTIEDVGVRTFLLNACRSYKQGAELIEKGSRVGVVTLSDVSNPAATKVGRTLTRLLNVGYPFRSALAIARKRTLSGYQYITIGDGGTELCQSISGMCSYGTVTRSTTGSYLFEFRSYSTRYCPPGTLGSIHLDAADCKYLTPGVFDTFELTADELDRFFELESMPVEYDGDLYWSDDISARDLD